MMRLIKCASIAAALLIVLGNTSSDAFAQAEHEQHHPQGAPVPDAGSPPAPADKGASPSEMPKGGMSGGGMMGGGMMGNMMQGGGMMGMMQGCPMMGMMMGAGGAETRVKGRVAFLKAELAITDSQKGAWDAYATALDKNLEGMQSAHRTMMKMMDAQSPVERLDAHIGVMEDRIATLKEIKPVLADLYASLSDEQKKTANQLLGGMGCMM